MWKKKSREIEPKKKKLVNSRQTCTHAAHARVTPTSLNTAPRCCSRTFPYEGVWDANAPGQQLLRKRLGPLRVATRACAFTKTRRRLK
jgi:hypothetical protein